MYDLDKLTDEQLGKGVRLLLRGAIHDRIVADKQALADVMEAEAAEAAERFQSDKAKRHLLVHKGYSLAGVVIPKFDASGEVLDEVVPANVRVPYNRALHRMGEPLLDPEVTWRALLVVHIVWQQFVINNRSNIQVDLDPDEKVREIAQAMEITEDEARELMEEAGL